MCDSISFNTVFLYLILFTRRLSDTWGNQYLGYFKCLLCDHYYNYCNYCHSAPSLCCSVPSEAAKPAQPGEAPAGRGTPSPRSTE